MNSAQDITTASGIGMFHKYEDISIPRVSTVPLLTGGQSSQLLGYKYLRTIVGEFVTSYDIQTVIRQWFSGGDDGYTLDNNGEMREPIHNALDRHTVKLTGFKYAAT